MAYRTYRLYYDTEIECEFCYDRDFYETDLDDQNDQDDPPEEECPECEWGYVDVSVCAAVIVVGMAGQNEGQNEEVQIAIMRPGSPNAPAWYGDYEADLVAEQVAAIVHAREDGTIHVAHPEDPSFELEEGAIVEAEGFNTATLMAMDGDVPTRVFGAFYIEYCPGGDTEPFPVAVFVIDALEGRLMGSDWGSNNPFAPRSYTRAQRRVVERRLKALNKKLLALVSGPKPETPHALNPARIMGPQFRTLGLPSVDAADITEATYRAIADLEVLLGKRQATSAS